MKTFTTYAEKKAKQFLNLLQGYTKGIRITAILILLLMGVNSAWAANGTITVYFKNTVNWSNVYVYFLTSSYWDQSNGCGSYGYTAKQMTYDSTLKLYKCTYTGNYSQYITFTKDKQDNYGNFWQTEAVYRSDFSTTSPVYVPSSTSNETKNSTKYYNNGSWVATTKQTLYYIGTLTTPYAYVWNSNNGNHSDWPGEKMTDSGKTYEGKVIYTITTPYTFENLIFSNNGNNQTSDLTLEADKIYDHNNNKWISYNYDVTITFNSNGKGNNPASKTVLKGNTITAPTAPSVTGYSVEGWYKEQACTNKWNFSTAVNADMTLFAKWTPVNYTITYNTNGGSGTMTPTSYTIETATFNLPTPTKTGYTFAGWYTKNDFSDAKVTQIEKGTTGNKTFYAKWTANTNTAYTVKHYKQQLNGTYSATPDETENLTGTTDASVTPAVKSYTGFTAPSTQTVTIKADGSFVVTYKYTRNSYKLTWDLDGGKITTAGTAAGQVKYEAPLSAPTVTKEGHNFTSWNPIVPSTMPASDATYTAQWQKKIYTVAYGVVGSANGTIALNSEDPAIKDQNKQDFEYGSTLTFTAEPNDGYQILGWYSDETGKTPLGNGTANTYTINPLTGAASVFVAFEKIPASTYIVTFNANGGNGTMNSQSFTENVPQNLAVNEFTRTGYTFSGWNTQADGKGDSYADGQSVTLTTAGLTLYAQWTANQYTITLDKQGGTGGTDAVTVHYDNNDYSANPVNVPSIQGYAFMGYYVAKNGSGFQVVDATGNWVKSAHGYTDASGNWKKASDITLYAYFKKAEITSITLDNTVLESGEGVYVTVTDYTIEPTPEGTTVVCWQLCYANGTPVNGHEPITEGNTVKFSVSGLTAGTYKIVGTLCLNNCNGEVLDTEEATFVIGGSYTVTIKYTCDGEEIAARTTQEGYPTKTTAATAPEIGGYNFVKWELGDGIYSESDLTNQTINYTATYGGYLTATYEKKKLIFLDLSKKFGTADWTAPHIYLYSAEFWDENKGTSATTNCVATGAMTKVPGTEGMWYYEYEEVTDYFKGYVSFTPTNKMEQENFWDTEVIHRGDFSIGTPVFVPAIGQTANTKNESGGKNAQYYNKGHWTKYMGGTGYTLKIFNKKESGRTELISVPFTGEPLYLPFTAVVNLEGGRTYGYKIVRDNDKWYKNDNDGTMTVNSHTNWPFIDDTADGSACGINTIAAGNYTFTLTLNATSGNFEVTVDYPVTVGDYRILYTDDTRSTYKPSDIKKKEETNTITSFFVRPGKNPKLKIQTAARVSEDGVTWANSNGIYFRPNSKWKEANARFAAYFYNSKNNQNTWKELTKNGDIYSCEKPNNYTHVIFVKLKPEGKGKTDKNDGLHWDYKEHQTCNLAIPTDGNLYTLEEDVWNGKVRLKPNANWKADGARFAAYFFEKNSDGSTKTEVWYSMTQEDNTDIYWCDIPEGCSNVIFCRMNGSTTDNNWNNKWNQTLDLPVPTDDKELYTVKEGTWDKGGGSWSDSFTSWTKLEGSITDLSKELIDKLNELENELDRQPDSVYTIHLSQSNGKFTIDKVAPYTGDFYIRVDAVAGKWHDYKTNPDNRMTYSAFSESEANSFGNKFSHYKTKWCPRGTNVKFVIANDYSLCISDTLIRDVVRASGEDYMTDGGELYQEDGGTKDPVYDRYSANIRFMWNRKTNEISRAYLSSSSNDARQFLVLKGCQEIKDETGNALSGNGDNHNEHCALLHDTQDWIYERTIQVKPNTRVKLYACYADKDITPATAQYFRGTYDDNNCGDEENSVQILGGNGESWNKIRVIYDFKTNRLMAALVPDNVVSEAQTIAADVMIIRQHQKPATSITLTNDNSKLTDVKTVYGSLQLNRWVLNNRNSEKSGLDYCSKKNGNQIIYDEDITNEHHPVLPLAKQKTIYERALYFISFPFDVHLSDVFGFGTYGTHWVISTYNGLRRAQRGYFEEDCYTEDCTNWDYIWDRDDFVMKANEGYLLSLDIDLMKYNNTDFWKNNIEQVELFFPSTANIETIEKTSYTMPELGNEYQCKINLNTDGKAPNKDRRVKDSYWRCIGVPSFADYDGSLYKNAQDAENGENSINWNTDYTWKTDESGFPFLYEWNVTDNSLYVQNTSAYKFKPTFAYLVQNGGAIYWKAVNSKPSSVIARQRTEADRNYEWKIALLRNGNQEDQTFVRITDNENVTTAFDFNQDLAKEFNYGRGDIYTLIGYERVAANSMPCSDKTTIIPLGLNIEQAGDYTIAMPEGVENIGITLVDNETGIHTNLSAGQEYTITLNKGICENRLFIEVSPIQQSTTDLEYTTEDTREQATRKMLIDGILYLIRDGVIYDAQGHRL